MSWDETLAKDGRANLEGLTWLLEGQSDDILLFLTLCKIIVIMRNKKERWGSKPPIVQLAPFASFLIFLLGSCWFWFRPGNDAVVSHLGCCYGTRDERKRGGVGVAVGVGVLLGNEPPPSSSQEKLGWNNYKAGRGLMKSWKHWKRIKTTIMAAGKTVGDMKYIP